MPDQPPQSPEDFLPKEKYDPHLKAAMEEMKAIIKKYDIAAQILLQSPTHGENYLEITPSWSCITLQNRPDGKAAIHFKAALKTGGPEERERGRVTVGMVMGFIDMSAHVFAMMGNVRLMLEEHMKIEHVSEFTPDTKPFNQ